MRKASLTGYLLLLGCGALACLPCACVPTTKGPVGFSPAPHPGRPECAVAIEYSGNLAAHDKMPRESVDEMRTAVAAAFREAGFAIRADADVRVTIGMTESMDAVYRAWALLAGYSMFIYPAYFPATITMAGTSGDKTAKVVGEYKAGVWLPTLPFLVDSYKKAWRSLLRDMTLGLIGKMQSEGILPVP